MKIGYNVSTINYLWQAENLAQSFLKYNPDYRFFVCIIDKIPQNWHEKNYQFSFEIIWIDEIKIDIWTKMVEYYTTFELVMSTKPFVSEYLFQKYEPQLVISLDSDMLIFDNFAYIEQQLDTYNIFITPHCHTPMPYLSTIDKVTSEFSYMAPYEDRVMLHVGIYNLGFFAIKNSPETINFRNWWMDRCRHQCYVGSRVGLFGEQLWVNLVPIYFEKVCILNHLGYNVGPWSLHERTITKKDNKFFINDTFPLVIYHYTGYTPDDPDKVAKWIPLTLAARPDLKEVFELYHKTFENLKYEELRKIPCAFIAEKQQIIASKKVIWKEPIQYKILRKLLSFMPKTIIEDIKHILQ
jgi:hypothetical protein